ncbi:hypothetical protein A2154_02325 [Candidatus Gottesmanbacteria bacterium RBG_16_43_7]|uniref:Uncharacterized protein n=1 Tax=Candidatus Gottesmanbacteria bacterium RBG_16_43_7 TaxID=1798373 RepID=A0A1F5Z868_9BACT|nr:MAG: hypothetical protein A2154_02325 [Candidatus Gottesmanbacteria bacterium RBG_16_43_7]
MWLLGRQVKSEGYSGPEIIVPRRVFDMIAREAQAHEPTETGQALLGIRTPTQIVILVTVPDLTDTIRQAAYFKQGGSDQVEIFHWHEKHWKAMIADTPPMSGWTPTTVVPKGTTPAELRLELYHVGDWHKHPGQLKILSTTDIGTIDGLFADPENRLSEYVAPIITASYYNQALLGERDAEVTYRFGTELQLNWYYLTKGESIIWHVKPTVVADKCLPWFPPLPWHLNDLERFQYELGQLQSEGHTVRWTVRQMDRDLEMEIIFAVDNPAWTKRLLITTDFDYPKSPPRIQIFSKAQLVAATTSAVTPVKRRRSRLDAFLDWLEQALYYGEGDTPANLFAPRNNLPDRSEETLLADLVADLVIKGDLTNGKS